MLVRNSSHGMYILHTPYGQKNGGKWGKLKYELKCLHKSVLTMQKIKPQSTMKRGKPMPKKGEAWARTRHVPVGT